MVEKALGRQGFRVLNKRVLAECSSGWPAWWGRLSEDYEKQPATSEAMTQFSMIRLVLRRIARYA